MLTDPAITVTWADLIVAAALVAILAAGTFLLGSAWEWARRGHARKHALAYTRQVLLIVQTALDNGHQLDEGHRRGVEKALTRIDADHAGGGCAVKPFTRRAWLAERVALYERLAEVDAALTRMRLRWDGAEARYRDATDGAFAVADLAEEYRTERDDAHLKAAVLAAVLDDVRGRCAEVRALHEDCDEPRHQGQAALAEELLKTIGDPDEPEPVEERTR